MGARTKLNTVYGFGSILTAALVGAMTDSGFGFLVTLILVLSAGIYNKEIRLNSRRRR